MKGLFIPGITAEMFRNGCLESIEALMAEGKIYDIDYQQPCEDAISRQTVLDKLNRLIEVERLQGTDEMGYGRERVSAYESMIFEIESKYLYPSVNPQQPCEDAVSRQAVLDQAVDYGSNTYLIPVNSVKTLPSVTPKEKTGNWETTTTRFCGRTFEVIECSCCKVKQEWFAETKFCPNCGARMQEVENDT